jgi:hypothetical protein
MIIKIKIRIITPTIIIRRNDVVTREEFENLRRELRGRSRSRSSSRSKSRNNKIYHQYQGNRSYNNRRTPDNNTTTSTTKTRQIDLNQQSGNANGLTNRKPNHMNNHMNNRADNIS